MNTAEDSKPPAELYCPSCEKHFRTGERCPDDDTRLVRLRQQDPFVGRELDGRYTISERIGSGGMGAVYRAHQHSVGRDVAVKVVNTHLVAETDVVKRFLREAKLASKLGHPNAVSVLDFGQTDDGVFYLVMELVVGRTLDVVIKAERIFRPERVVKIGAQICDALEAAHSLSIVHRDLKPSNVMLLDGGRDLVKVLDFGLAKSVAPDQTSTTMTGAGAVLGTPAFMPPELALGSPCDGRADLYSLGCMLYLMGSGQLPFTSDSMHDLMTQHAHARAPRMRGVPNALGEVIDQLLEKRAEDRYQSAAATREALEESLASISSPVRTIVAGSRPRSGTEMDRLISSNTELHESPDPVAPVKSVIAQRERRARWPLIAGALVVVTASVVAVVALRRDPAHEDRPIVLPVERPAPPPAAVAPPITPPPVVVAPPPVVVEPPQPPKLPAIKKPQVTVPPRTKPPEVVVKPPPETPTQPVKPPPPPTKLPF